MADTADDTNLLTIDTKNATYWLYRGRVRRALQAALLSVISLVIAGGLIHRFRHNPGALAEN